MRSALVVTSSQSHDDLPKRKMTISVLILTLNEADNIAACIESLPWRDDVHVLDSGSTDATREVAAGLGAHIHVRAFDTYSAQRNAGFVLPFKGEWIVSLDADERMTPELAREIEERVRSADEMLSMMLVRRRDMLMGRWLRRASGYPTWFARAFRKGCVTVMRDVNEEYRACGRAEQLDGHILHYPFGKGGDWWFERHIRYSTLEARTLLKERVERPIRISALFSGKPATRRATLKQIAYRLPGRPYLVFLYLYLLRGGFLDGGAGFHYAQMRLAYEIMIDAKMTFARRSADETPRS